MKISYKRAWCTVCYLYNKQQVTKLISKCLFVTLCKVFESRPTGTRMIDGYGTGVRYRPIPRSPGIGVGTGKVVPLHPFSEHPVIERYQSLRIFASLRGSRTWTIRWIDPDRLRHTSILKPELRHQFTIKTLLRTDVSM